MRFPISLVFFSLGICHGAIALKSGKHCLSACELNLNYVTFNDADAKVSFKVKACQSRLRAASLYLCFAEYCTQDGRDEWLREENTGCQRLANLTLPPFDIVSNYTPEDVARVRRLPADRGSSGIILNEVVIPDANFFDRAFQTLVAAYFEVDIHVTYGIAMYYFWVTVIAIGVGTRFTALIRRVQRQEWSPIPEDDFELDQYRDTKHAPMLSSSYTLLKRYIIFPATFGYRCSQNVGWCTIPPRIQALTIATFVVLNTVLCSVSYPVVHGNLYWPKTSDQLWRYVSDRTGVISLMNFPLVWLFGTRNNVLMWLTGWGFGTFNNFHRWVARVATAQAMVHSVGYTVMIMQRGGWNHMWKYLQKHYFWNGELATIGMCAILGFSVYGLRRSHYEIFLVTHIIFSIVVLITMFYHVEIFVDGEWNIFIYLSVLLWAVDRFVRTLRTLAFNWKFWNTRGFASYDIATNLIRLEIPCSQSMLKTKPGNYYYLYLLNDALFVHQNHPFTLAYVNDAKADSYWRSPSRPDIQRTPSYSSIESDSLLYSSQAPPVSSLVFLIRPYDGFTSRLKKLASLTRRRRSLRVLVEGPYGDTIPLHNFSNIAFVVGGTGIAVPLSYLSRLLSEGSKACNIHIVWAVRSYALLADVSQRDFRGLLDDERVTLTAHITQDDELKDDLIDGLKYVDRLKIGRPDVDAAVEKAAKEAGSRGLAIVACGPSTMADDARRATVRALADGHRSIEYFEESFKW
ncbi:ferric-chelate reductase-like protein [Lophiotrema nucula]|uniref:Ferric-chelate reductase-like protein n=1 Tax=Lophiotrema nucula TaxID=690887 RepID=A0A6A5YGJ0_9PLEO|nr:ferric-chelate reductase-like protein [Lophiotrema nucula]